MGVVLLRAEGSMCLVIFVDERCAENHHLIHKNCLPAIMTEMNSSLKNFGDEWCGLIESKMEMTTE